MPASAQGPLAPASTRLARVRGEGEMVRAGRGGGGAALLLAGAVVAVVARHMPDRVGRGVERVDRGPTHSLLRRKSIMDTAGGVWGPVAEGAVGHTAV